MARVLIIKLGALGDVIMTTALLEPIMRHHDKDSVTLLTTPAYAELFHRWPALTVTALPRSGLRSFFAMLAWIRRQRFGCVYDLQSNDRSGLLCALSGIRERIGNHPRFPYTRHPETPYRGQSHIYDRMREVLAAAGINTAPALPRLAASAEDRQRVAHWLEVNNLENRRLVLMHAGASRQHPEKRWPGFAELATSLTTAGFEIAWLGTNDDAVINQQLSAVCGTDATGAFSILQLAELGRHAAFAVTNDSGPMHILSAAPLPVYALFGPTNWRRNHAIGQERNVISGNDNETTFTPVDINSIPVDRVLRKLQADNRLPGQPARL